MLSSSPMLCRWDMSHLHVCHDSFVRVPWLTCSCRRVVIASVYAQCRNCVWMRHDALFRLWDMTQLCVGHDPIVCGTWLVCRCVPNAFFFVNVAGNDVTRSFAWHEVFVCCDVWRDLFMCRDVLISVTWLSCAHMIGDWGAQILSLLVCCFFLFVVALCHFTGFARLVWGRSNVLAQLPHSEWFLHCLFLLYYRRQYAALLVYAWDDSFVCSAWLFCIGVMTRSYVWRDEFYVTRRIAASILHLGRTCNITGSCVWRDLSQRCHDSSVCATRRNFFRICMCDATNFFRIRMCDATKFFSDPYVRRDEFFFRSVCVTRRIFRIHMCDATNFFSDPYVRRDEFFSWLVTWLIQICSRTHLSVCRGKALNGTRRISVRHDAFGLMPWLICTYDVTHSCVWRDSFVCVAWLFCMDFMTHLCMWSDEFYITREIAASMLHFWRTRYVTRSCVWHDCCVWLSWLIRVCDATHYFLWLVTRRIQMCGRTQTNMCRQNKAFCLQNAGKWNIEKNASFVSMFHDFFFKKIVKHWNK